MPAKQAAWEAKYGQPTVWETLDLGDLKSKGGATLTKQKDGSVLVSGDKNVTPEVYTVTSTTKLKGLTAVRLEALSDPALPSKGPGRAPNGNFVLNEFKLTVGKVGDKARPKPAKFEGAVADFSQEGYNVAAAIDGNPTTGWAVFPQMGRSHQAMFKLASPIGFDEGTLLTFVMDQRYEGKLHNLGKFRLSVTTAKEPLLRESLPDAILKAIPVPLDKRTAEQKTAVANHYRGLDMELKRLQQAVADAPAPSDVRLVGAQDLAWALLNSPAFLFNH
jgi:hypothetical protein